MHGSHSRCRRCHHPQPRCRCRCWTHLRRHVGRARRGCHDGYHADEGDDVGDRVDEGVDDVVAGDRAVLDSDVRLDDCDSGGEPDRWSAFSLQESTDKQKLP
jgi:hypothetical protein